MISGEREVGAAREGSRRNLDIRERGSWEGR
jgi:hypothetical protein